MSLEMRLNLKVPLSHSSNSTLWMRTWNTKGSLASWIFSTFILLKFEQREHKKDCKISIDPQWTDRSYQKMFDTAGSMAPRRNSLFAPTLLGDDCLYLGATPGFWKVLRDMATSQWTVSLVLFHHRFVTRCTFASFDFVSHHSTRHCSVLLSWSKTHPSI